jgi:hypothetical protein
MTTTENYELRTRTLAHQAAAAMYGHQQWRLVALKAVQAGYTDGARTAAKYARAHWKDLKSILNF